MRQHNSGNTSLRLIKQLFVTFSKRVKTGWAGIRDDWLDLGGLEHFHPFVSIHTHTFQLLEQIQSTVALCQADLVMFTKCQFAVNGIFRRIYREFIVIAQVKVHTQPTFSVGVGYSQNHSFLEFSNMLSYFDQEFACMIVSHTVSLCGLYIGLQKVESSAYFRLWKPLACISFTYISDKMSTHIVPQCVPAATGL